MDTGIQTQTRCFACGQQHPFGLQLRFRSEKEGRVTAEWTPSDAWEGFQGLIHGGVVSTVLDEAMSKAVTSAGTPGLTCLLEVRLRRSIAPGEPLIVRGWVVEKRRRRVRVEAEIRDSADVERAHGWATFLT
jgi:acyl-coenzyme A thioesterase PaaI-like protein